MDILVIGSGGREHAIIMKLAESKRCGKLYCAPGNGGISRFAECFNVKATDIDGMVVLAKQLNPGMVVVAPDDPLVLGMTDAMQAAGFLTFGPTKAAAIIEGSKVFSKNLMKKYSIPTAGYESFTDSALAIAYIKAQNTYPTVIKADGLALGKGVIIAQDEAEAVAAIRSMLEDKVFGESGARLVVEEFLTGPEVSVLCFTDGETLVPMVSSMDHKRALDGDEGLNTGGMGTVSPNPYYTDALAAECMETIFLPTMRAMNAEERRFEGCLYFGLMLTEKGPKVIEYNCRFGDPETQVVLPLLDCDLIDVFEAVYHHRLAEVKIVVKPGFCTCVVMASKGYPQKYETGKVISGLDEKGQARDVFVYHAGTTYADGEFRTAGGRVLGVTGAGLTLQGALDRSYAAVKGIAFAENYTHYRTDIGQRALAAFSTAPIAVDYKDDMEDYLEDNGVYLRQ
ncbi:MAG: phosphoribosylamine--glycine ligase [Oscillospiraceae bacterium]